MVTLEHLQKVHASPRPILFMSQNNVTQWDPQYTEMVTTSYQTLQILINDKL